MNTRELDRALLAADPVDPGGLERLDLAAMEADLLADMESGSAPSLVVPDSALPRHRAPRRRPLALGVGAAALAAIVAVLVLVLSGGGSGGGSRAYGAELVRFAESTPLLLLEEPGWRVADVTENRVRGGTDGSMEFLNGKQVPPGSLRPEGVGKDGKEIVSGLPPASDRRRQIFLYWHAAAEEPPLSELHGAHYVKVPVLGTTAIVNTRAESFANSGGPTDHEMTATWAEDGLMIELEALVPNLAAMKERLGWLTKVDSQSWLEAMPAKVVKAANFEGTVREMLKGVALPKSFAISRVPDEGLTTARAVVAGKVATTVSCLWLRQWGAARRSGDEAAESEAEQALAGAKDWPFLRPGNDASPYPREEIEEVAAAMPQGYWPHRGHQQDLLKHAESLGCARQGLPLLPEKMKRQRETGVPPPPG